MLHTLDDKNGENAKKIEANDTKKMEAKKLKEIYESKKTELGLQQVILAERNKTSTGTIYSYLNGKAPLNYEIASFFAKNLEVQIEDFSPRLAKKLNEMTTISVPIFEDIKQLSEYIETSKIATSVLENLNKKTIHSLSTNLNYYRLDRTLKAYDGSVLLPKGTLALMRKFDKTIKLKDKMIALVKVSLPEHPIKADELDKEINKRGFEDIPFNTLLSTGKILIQNNNFIFTNNKYIVAQLRLSSEIKDDPHNTTDNSEIKDIELQTIYELNPENEETEYKVCYKDVRINVKKDQIQAIVVDATYDNLVI